MSRASEYANAVSSLYAQIGAARAIEAANKGQLWGSALSNIGQYVAQIPQQRAEMERIKNQAAETDLRRQELERQATRTAQDDADDQKIRELFTADTLPPPDVILRTVGPKKGIPIINGLAALKGDPQGDPEKSLKLLQQVANGLNALPEDMRAAAYPSIVESFEQRGIVKPGMLQKEYSPDYWRFIMGTGQEPPKPKGLEKVETVEDGQAVTKFVEPKPGESFPKPVAEMTPYQKAELEQQQKNFGLAQQRLALAIKQANKPAIAQQASGMADAIMAHPELFGQLTPTAKEKVIPELERRGFTEFKKPPSATVENRLASAQAVQQTGNDIITALKDPKIAAMVGPAMGRYNSLRDFIGNPPPELSELAGSIESYALANMGVHGMRSVQGADEIKKLLDRKHTPESLIQTIQGLQKFSQHFLENEDPKRLTTPKTTPTTTTPAGGMSYQDYLKSKGQK